MTIPTSHACTVRQVCMPAELITCSATARYTSWSIQLANRLIWDYARERAGNLSTMSIRVSFNLLLIALSFAICGCGADPVDVLVDKLHDPDANVRRAAVHSLAEYSSNDQ